MLTSPACNCCNNCTVETDTALNQSAAWSVLEGTWTFSSPLWTLSGAEALVVSTSTASGPQWLQLEVTAGAAGQVLDILLGAAADGEADLFVRLTFGDSSTPGSCGSVQLFEGETALEDAQLMPDLVDGVTMRVRICVDADLRRFVAFMYVASETPTDWRGATAVVTNDPDGAIGLRLTEDQGGAVEVEWIDDVSDSAGAPWKRMWVTATTCQSCTICDTVIDNWTHPYPTDTAESTCVHTVSGSWIQFPGGEWPANQEQGVRSIESAAIISQLDRERGYSVMAAARMRITAEHGAVCVVTFDNGHHEARLTISETTCGTYPHTATLELLKDGSVIASGTYCLTSRPIEDWTINAGFCDGVAFANGWQRSLLIEQMVVSIASEQVGDGSLHGAHMGDPTAYGASEDDGGITALITKRCTSSIVEGADCDQCEVCDEVNVARSWQVVLSGMSDSAWNGTFIVPTLGSLASASSAVMCTFRYQISTGKYVHVSVERAYLKITLTTTIDIGSAVASGKSDAPRPDCDDVVDEVIPLTGTLSGTATVTAV